MRVRRGWAGLLVACALTSCSTGNQKPTVLPTLSPAPPTSTPTPAVVPTQSGIAAPTPQGAAAFARFWFANLNTAASTGDTATLAKLSTPTCSSCRRFISSIDQTYRAGKIVGGRFEVRAAEAPAFEPSATRARVSVLYDISPTRILDSQGATVKEVPARRGVDADATLRRYGTGWLMDALAVQP